MREKKPVNVSELPGDENSDLQIKTKKFNTSVDDDRPARLELSLTQGEKKDLIKNAKAVYGLKPSALIRMLLKEKGVI